MLANEKLEKIQYDVNTLAKLLKARLDINIKTARFYAQDYFFHRSISVNHFDIDQFYDLRNAPKLQVDMIYNFIVYRVNMRYGLDGTGAFGDFSG